MIKSGMVSVTFRNKTPEEIIAIASKAKLDAIEWGSDVYVSPGNVKAAKEIYEKTIAAGLEVASYGSYYMLGEGDDFQAVLDSAIALHAPNIRVWAGKNKASKNATEEDWNRIADDASRISAIADKKNISISLEYHANTLTDTLDSTLLLLSLVPESNFYTYWQPPLNISIGNQLPELNTLLQSGRVSNIHVYQHKVTYEGEFTYERELLKEGIQAWEIYLNAVNDSNLRYAFLEFVADDNDDIFLQDSKILNMLKDKVNRNQKLR